MDTKHVTSFSSICLLIVTAMAASSTTELQHPNIVIFLADDMGYGDLSSYGHPTQEWGPIDDLAREGLRFTSMYTASSLCSPSRAALLTGRLPVRVGMYGLQMNFTPLTPTGMPPEEITLAEALRDAGYSTGMVGKWHLGINSRTAMDGAFLPYRNGFDYVGTNLPYTNLWSCDENQIHVQRPNSLGCYLYRNATIIQQPIAHENLTRTFVEDAKTFIGQHHKTRIDKPFFLFMSFAHPHVNLFSNKNFNGSSQRGVYGDNIREMSWGVGEIMREIKRLGFDENTLVLFSSDNGGQLELCNEGGDNGIFRGGKGNFFDGGLRVPGIVRWPGHIRPGRINTQVISQMDIFPTFVQLAGGNIPHDRVIDGQDVRHLLSLQSSSYEAKNPTSKSSNHEPLFFYCNDKLFAVRYGNFKFHYRSMPVKSKFEYAATCGEAGFPNDYYFECLFCGSRCVLKHDPPLIYNLAADPSEAYSLDPQLHQGLLQELKRVVEDHESNLVKGPALFTSLAISSIPCCDKSSPGCSCNYP
ncbi:arylsulfatase-like [Amphiura filiformis]|uniref:arylsulfatase-like n=1 Tax=Amphiura filiformis TaxID=82378 RepID=UPI003B221643